MQRNAEIIKQKIESLLSDGTVDRVAGWKKGEFFYDPTPAVFHSSDALTDFVYHGFCGANVSKYLIRETKKDGRILALLKPCDTYSFNQLIKEHRIDRDRVFVLGIGCDGMLDINKVKNLGMKGVTAVEEKDAEILVHTIYGNHTCKREDVLLEKCISCKGKKHVAFDECIDVGLETDETANKAPNETTQKRFDMVAKLESMTPEERYEFWRGELSKCIRCNACRNVCPACSCVKCVFDNDQSGVAGKSNADPFEENLFHIIRAYHVAGRCTDCGECSRVCPQHIPLHLLNRKFIKDINEYYGEYQAGADTDSRTPLTDFNKEDAEPDAIRNKGGNP